MKEINEIAVEMLNAIKESEENYKESRSKLELGTNS